MIGETPHHHKFSRRDFIKFGFLAAAAAFLPPTTSNDVESAATETLSLDPVDSLIDEVEKKYKIRIFMSPLAPTGEKSLPWELEELQVIQAALNEVPPVILNNPRFPQLIILYKIDQPPVFDGFIKVGYDGKKYSDKYTGAISIITSTEFNLNTPNTSIELQIFRTEGNLLKAAIIHESAHSFTENTGVLEEWNKKFGWSQNINGTWENTHPEQIIPHGYARSSPEEDYSCALSIMALNPDYLLTHSQDRFKFFANHPLFQDWELVKFIKERKIGL